MEDVERCLFDLRRGLPVRITDASVDVLVWPLEHLNDSALERLRGVCVDNLSLIVTRHRLASVARLDDAQHLDATARINVAPAEQANDIIRRACAPDADIDASHIRSDEASNADALAIYLMRRALLIPAAVVATVDPANRSGLDHDVETRRLLAVDPATIRGYQDEQPVQLSRVSEADVPLAEAANTHFVVFREPDGMREHVAILIGNTGEWPESVPVRLHSACLTGDLFASLRCDCGEQLRGSVSAIAERGGGVLLYLAQEGRGIGLANKMRAYHLQDDGLDTVDADQVLGFGEDERRYNVAGQMLTALAIDQIDLLTNNPSKIDAMHQEGIDVTARSAIYGNLTRDNRRYLNAKATRAGHWLDSLLDDAAEG